MASHKISPLQHAKEILGTEAALAKAVGASQPYINYRLKRGKRVPAEWCIPIELATGGRITRHDLRPDLYPKEEERVA